MKYYKYYCNINETLRIKEIKCNVEQSTEWNVV